MENTLRPRRRKGLDDKVLVGLDGNVSEMLGAIAQYRPDLLHHTNRGTPLTAD
jgi:hypothetical protein